MDGEAANGITNNGNVDIEGIDENASSSTASHTINDVEHDKTDANNDDANNDANAEAESNAVSSEEKPETKSADAAGNYLCHQVCYETISNDSADNNELDLSVGLNKEADNDEISPNNATDKVEDIVDVDTKQAETNNGNELENDDDKKPDITEEKPDDDDDEQVLPVPAEEISAAKETEHVNESANNSDAQVNKPNDTDTPKSVDDLAIEATEADTASVSGENSAEVAHSFDEIPAENDVALPAETADAEKAALGESSELEQAAEPTVEASSPTREEAASKKPL